MPSEVKRPRKREEATLQERAAEMLALDGWRRIKTDLKQLRGMGVQEKGMADDLFLRYFSNGMAGLFSKGMADVLWIEWKAKSGLHTTQQVEWQLLERIRGGLVWVAKKDFEPTLDAFWSFYRGSGLLRNQGLTLQGVNKRRIS